MAAVKLLIINVYINNASPPLTYGLMIEVAEWPNVGIIPSLQVGQYCTPTVPNLVGTTLVTHDRREAQREAQRLKLLKSWYSFAHLQTVRAARKPEREVHLLLPPVRNLAYGYSCVDEPSHSEYK